MTLRPTIDAHRTVPIISTQNFCNNCIFYSVLTVVAIFLQDEGIKQTALLMYQTALMESGFMLQDPKDFATRIYSSVKTSLDISPNATVEEEDETEEAEVEEKEADGADTIKEGADEHSSFKDEL